MGRMGRQLSSRGAASKAGAKARGPYSLICKMTALCCYQSRNFQQVNGKEFDSFLIHISCAESSTDLLGTLHLSSFLLSQLLLCQQAQLVHACRADIIHCIDQNTVANARISAD